MSAASPPRLDPLVEQVLAELAVRRDPRDLPQRLVADAALAATVRAVHAGVRRRARDPLARALADHGPVFLAAVATALSTLGADADRNRLVRQAAEQLRHDRLDALEALAARVAAEARLVRSGARLRAAAEALAARRCDVRPGTVRPAVRRALRSTPPHEENAMPDNTPRAGVPDDRPEQKPDPQPGPRPNPRREGGQSAATATTAAPAATMAATTPAATATTTTAATADAGTTADADRAGFHVLINQHLSDNYFELPDECWDFELPDSPEPAVLVDPARLRLVAALAELYALGDSMCVFPAIERSFAMLHDGTLDIEDDCELLVGLHRLENRGLAVDAVARANLAARLLGVDSALRSQDVAVDTVIGSGWERILKLLAQIRCESELDCRETLLGCLSLAIRELQVHWTVTVTAADAIAVTQVGMAYRATTRLLAGFTLAPSTRALRMTEGGHWPAVVWLCSDRISPVTLALEFERMRARRAVFALLVGYDDASWFESDDFLRATRGAALLTC